MILYKIYSFHTCGIIVSHLTEEQAKELAGPLGNFAAVKPMDAADYARKPT